MASSMASSYDTSLHLTDKEKKAILKRATDNPHLPISRARGMVNEIVLALQAEDFRRGVGIETTEVFQGGSVGHGTAVPGHYDVDLVLYSRSLDCFTAVKNKGYSDIPKKINHYLQRTLGHNYIPSEVRDVAVKFVYSFDDGMKIDIDLLLSPFWKNEEELFTAMRKVKPPIRRLMFSASASKWQTKFIRQQNQHVKELIRRAKAWRNIVWGGNKDGRPKSYLISMLVIIAYNRVPSADMLGKQLKEYSHKVTAEFKHLVKAIERDKNLDLSIPGARLDLQRAYADLLPDKPRIVDPVNPSNNLYLSGVGPITYGPGDGKWSIFAREIDTIDLA